jgi:hypothetical protein
MFMFSWMTQSIEQSCFSHGLLYDLPVLTSTSRKSRLTMLCRVCNLIALMLWDCAVF